MAVSPNVKRCAHGASARALPYSLNARVRLSSYTYLWSAPGTDRAGTGGCRAQPEQGQSAPRCRGFDLSPLAGAPGRDETASGVSVEHADILLEFWPLLS
jgi:hypothetical protein